MERNEAPEKIYVDSKAIGDNISTTVRTLPQDYPTCTEYIRADAFIEKATKWLKENAANFVSKDYKGEPYLYRIGLADEFIKAMML